MLFLLKVSFSCINWYDGPSFYLLLCNVESAQYTVGPQVFGRYRVWDRLRITELDPTFESEIILTQQIQDQLRYGHLKFCRSITRETSIYDLVIIEIFSCKKLITWSTFLLATF